jgi:hypothetical protein
MIMKMNELTIDRHNSLIQNYRMDNSWEDFVN